MTADKRRVCLFAVDLYSPDESPADANDNQFIIKKKQLQQKSNWNIFTQLVKKRNSASWMRRLRELCKLKSNLTNNNQDKK